MPDEYISREAAIALLKKEAAEMSEAFDELGGESGIYAEEYDDAANMLRELPAADAVPVVHGRWVLHHTATGNPYTECSNCCTDFKFRTDKGTLAKLDMRGMLYCPSCGARMDGAAE